MSSTADPDAASLACVDVTRRHGSAGDSVRFQLAPTSLRIEPETWTAITGRSGSGKTTLLSILTGLDRPDSGRVWMFGEDVTTVPTAALARIRRERMGIVYQQFHFIEHLPLWQNVTCRLVPTGVPWRERRRRAQVLLDELGLPPDADRLPTQLSGGEQQRVALARALVDEPDVLVADEPTSNVDARTAEVILEHFTRVQARGGAVVISTHDPLLVRPATDRLELTPPPAP